MIAGPEDRLAAVDEVGRSMKALLSFLLPVVPVIAATEQARGYQEQR